MFEKPIQHKIIIAFLMVLFFTQKVKADSTYTKGFSLKGIDFRYGFGRYNLRSIDEKNLAKQFTNDQNNYYKFNQSLLAENNGTAISDIYLGLIFSPKINNKKNVFTKQEIRIGVSFTLLNNASTIALAWDTINNGNQKEVKQFFYQYKYNSQKIHFSYLLNSKILKNSLAFYGGIGFAFGFSNWRSNFEGRAGSYSKQVLTSQNNQVSDIKQYVPLENFRTGNSLIYIPLGIKYNLSYDINLFAEANIGYQYFLKGINTNNTWLPSSTYNFGFRLKLIDDNQAIKQGAVFW